LIAAADIFHTPHACHCHYYADIFAERHYATPLIRRHYYAAYFRHVCLRAAATIDTSPRYALCHAASRVAIKITRVMLIMLMRDAALYRHTPQHAADSAIDTTDACFHTPPLLHAADT